MTAKFKKGDLVFVESIVTTTKRHGSNSSMERMIGTEANVTETRLNRIILKDTRKNTTWIFAVEDLILASSIGDTPSEAMKTEQLMFDPNELVT